jgi:protein TonB
MHSNSILNSNLLDIIFENRNKDYGAYALRKNYNKRLFKSLLSMLVLVAIFSFWQMLMRKNITINFSSTRSIEGPTISSIQKKEKQTESKKSFHSSIKPSKDLNNHPVIVKTNNDKPTLTNTQILTSNLGNNHEGPNFDGQGIDGLDTGGDATKDSVKSSSPVIDKKFPVTPEVLPQFPGGRNELLRFLKRNLNTPRDMEQGEEIAVKIKFVVSYNGDLMGFTVVETGGELFDSEVIRVLKKMPKWIPGKANGENVSAYFVIPVKFMPSN